MYESGRFACVKCEDRGVCKSGCACQCVGACEYRWMSVYMCDECVHL